MQNLPAGYYYAMNAEILSSGYLKGLELYGEVAGSITVLVKFKNINVFIIVLLCGNIVLLCVFVFRKIWNQTKY